MSRIPAVLLMLWCGACSEHRAGEGELPDRADFLPNVSANAPQSPNRLAEEDSPDTLQAADQARLLLRCEGGRVHGYVILDDSAVAQTSAAEVPVTLDSAISC